ncbi:MAG: hypothetical protein C0483_25540 [Pirellula sp.]|nr:hypothetical protein [Pirellula sp.]
MLRVTGLVTTALLLAVSCGGAFAQNAAAPTATLAEVERHLETLASDDFSAREAASRALLRLAATPDGAALVNEGISRRAPALDVDLEARELLAELRQALPPGPPDARGAATLDAVEVDSLLRALDAAEFARRDAAQARLTAAAGETRNLPVLVDRTKSRLATSRISLDTRRRLEVVWDAVWSAWLQHEPKPGELREVADADIEALIDQLLRAGGNGDKGADAVHGHATAERELLFLLARDDLLPRLRAILEKRWKAAEASSLPLDAVERLQTVYDWSRPAMVAEFWEGGEHKAIQHLILGVPNQPANAPKPSLFDRCDDRTAHCVSGNSLSPGDWPVGVFFPHPSSLQDGAQFHLKNLPTPRRRLAYQYEVPTHLSRERQQTLDAVRRKAITRNTCRRWLEEKHRLVSRELDMLPVLDPEEVSLFAADYLTTVPDERIPHDSPTAFGNGSSHGLFCYQLSRIGTASAGVALQKAIDRKLVLLPVEETPYRMDWVALLVVAERYRWPGRDAWLAEHIASTDAINIREPDVADVGASVAAVLVRATGGSESEFALKRHEFPELIDLENPGFRFTRPEGRAAVEMWWRERGGREASKTGP